MKYAGDRGDPLVIESAARQLFGQLALQAGHPIDWTGISQAEMVHASIAAYNSDAAELAR